MIHPVHWFHERQIHRRRVRVIANWIGQQLPKGASVLDVGCGDGKLAAIVGQQRPDVSVRGIDVLVREETAIKVDGFDGATIPFDRDQFDVVMMVDVLHHTDAPGELLKEATRVASQLVVIKDHYLRGFAAYRTLRFMDHVSNARHGVEIPCNYLAPNRWSELFRQSDLRVRQCIEHLGLYPPPLSWIFERRLHFLAALEVDSKS